MSSGPGGELGVGASAPPPFVESVGFTLSTLGFAVSAGFHERLRPLGLEPKDFALMRTVEADEGSSQHEVAARLGMPASRMVAFLDGLQERGLLERRAHPTDRRARALFLTEPGRRVLGEAFAVAAGYERELCGGLGDGQRELLLEMLGAVREALGIAPGVHSAHAHHPGQQSDDTSSD